MRLSIIWMVSVFALLAACTGRSSPAPTPAVIPSRTIPPGVTLVSTSTGSPVPLTATSTPPPPPATVTPVPSRPANFTHPAQITLAQNLPGPDDLLIGPDGSIYVSDVTDGSIRQLAPDGTMRIFLSGLNEPEGMVFLPDGSMIIAEQGRNRLVRWDPHTDEVQPLLDLENRTGLMGVDGIALDARPGSPVSLIIPDSPNNRLLRAGVDGKNVTEIAHGLSRPVGAWVEADGNILVVEENGAALDRIRPDGSIQKLAQLPTPDDVVEDSSGNVFVAALGDGSVHWIHNGQDTIIAQGFDSPQGLAIDSAGNLIVTDPGHHRLVKLVIH